MVHVKWSQLFFASTLDLFFYSIIFLLVLLLVALIYPTLISIRCCI